MPSAKIKETARMGPRSYSRNNENNPVANQFAIRKPPPCATTSMARTESVYLVGGVSDPVKKVSSRRLLAACWRRKEGKRRVAQSV